MTLHTHRIRIASLVLLLLAAACAPGAGTGPIIPSSPVPPRADVLPALQREFRGVWIATVANIDWPSRPGLSAAQQQAELRTLLDRAQGAGMNAVVFHVRPAADALYRSELEPWGAMLTGRQGGDPGFDPLAYAVEQAHARGLELHAWINPFRAGNSADTTLAPTHVSRARPELVRRYGTQLWLDPGEPGVHDHTMRVILDIVRRYDVDAVHLDDYFYPYPQNAPGGGRLAFPDSASYARYGNGAAIGDWRRANVDRFVERLYREVHAAKPGVLVGISPFGIWRPNNPPGVTGLDAYADIYADARKWLREGWVDYMAPQLYWPIARPQQSYTALLAWWLNENPAGRFVWPGLATYKVFEANAGYSNDEILEQVRQARTRNAGGVVFYNGNTTLSRNAGQIATALRTNVFQSGALRPAARWLDPSAPAAPTVTVAEGTIRVSAAPGEMPRWWAVRSRSGGVWTTRLVRATETAFAIEGSAAADWVVVNAVNMAGNASADATWRR